MPELKCENPSCQCKAGTDAASAYCSDYCSANAIQSASCECGHANCKS